MIDKIVYRVIERGDKRFYVQSRVVPGRWAADGPNPGLIFFPDYASASDWTDVETAFTDEQNAIREARRLLVRQSVERVVLEEIRDADFATDEAVKEADDISARGK